MLIISTRYLHIGTYKATGFKGFYVDVQLDTEEKVYTATLFHDKYGVRSEMFGVTSDNLAPEEFIELAERNLADYVEQFIHDREREDGQDWEYWE